MKINITELIHSITDNFPDVLVELLAEETGFKEIRITGDNDTMLFLYPNEEAFFIKMYPTQELYKQYVFQNIRENLMSKTNDVI